MKKGFVVLGLLFCFIIPVFADPSVEDIISNLQANQALIKDMSADTVTTITSTMKGAKNTTKKGNILTKYPDMSRTETFSPIHQVMITNGDKMININKDTGQRTEQVFPMSTGNGQMNLEKAREQFDLSIRKNDDMYIIVGTPKTENKFLGKMEITVDPSIWLVQNVKILTPQGKVISESAMEYSKLGEIWVLSKTITTASTPMGNMKMESAYENIKINQGLKDNNFD